MDNGLAVLDEVLARLLAAADAPSSHTMASYQRRWRMWEAFALHHGVPVLPADPEHVAAFAVARRRAGVSDGTVAANLSAVLWFHRALAEELSGTCDLAKRALSAMRRVSERPAVTAPAPVLSVGALEHMVRTPVTYGNREFAAKVLRLMSGAEPRQLSALTVSRVRFGKRHDWVRFRTPAVRPSRTRRAIPEVTYRFNRGFTALDCPVEALQTLVALADETGRLFPSGFPNKAVIKGFMPATAPDGVLMRIQVRDRAVVRVGYAGALRLQELVRANVEDLEATSTGYRLRLVGAKTSRGRQSQFVLLTSAEGPLDPVASLDEWLAVRGDHDGPLFCSLHHGRHGDKPGGALSSGEMLKIIRGLAVAAGLPPTVSGHSLRRSWATHSYLRNPADLTAISRHLRHSSVDMTARYIDDLGLHLLDASDYLSRDSTLVSGTGVVVRPKDLGFDDASLEDLGQEVSALTEDARPRAQSTRRVEASMWNVWMRWAESKGIDPIPASPESLAVFAAARSVEGISAPALRAQLRTIRQRHEDQGFDASDLTGMADGIVSGLARSAPRERAKAPVLTLNELLQIATVAFKDAEATGSLEARRDLLMLTVGYGGALRVDDLYRARIELIEDLPYGLALRFATSKENPLGTANESVLLLGRDDALDPVAAMAAWIKATGFRSGPLIPVLTEEPRVPLSKDSMPERLRSMARAAGIPTRPTGHSLRRSWATHAYEAGVDPVTLSRHLRHQDLTTTLGYIRALSPWRDNAAAALLAHDTQQED